MKTLVIALLIAFPAFAWAQPITTPVDCNVYAAPSGSPIRIGSPASLTATIAYATPQAFGTAMAGASPYPDIDGIDANSLSGGLELIEADGTPTELLDHEDACAVPVNAAINAYLGACEQHFGVDWQ